jgi:galactokinase
LSSSAALEVATAPLGELLGGVTIDPLEKALLCQKAEHVSAGTPCGVMDQFAVVFGKRGHLLLIDCRSLDRELVGMREGEVSLLIINTMVKHSLSDGGYKTRRDECNEVAQLLGVKLLREQTRFEGCSRLRGNRYKARGIRNQAALMAISALTGFSQIFANLVSNNVQRRIELQLRVEDPRPHPLPLASRPMMPGELRTRGRDETRGTMRPSLSKRTPRTRTATKP